MVLPDVLLQRPAFRKRVVSFIALWMQQSMQLTVAVYLLSSDAVNDDPQTPFELTLMGLSVIASIWLCSPDSSVKRRCWVIDCSRTQLYRQQMVWPTLGPDEEDIHYKLHYRVNKSTYYTILHESRVRAVRNSK